MRYKKIVPAHVEERVVCDGTTCDSCGKTIGDGDEPYTMNEITIGAKLGEYYPDGDCRAVYDLDVCARCFLAKVVPALASVGLVFRERDVDDDDRVFGPIVFRDPR